MIDSWQLRLEALKELGIPFDVYLTARERRAVKLSVARKRRAAEKAEKDMWVRRALERNFNE